MHDGQDNRARQTELLPRLGDPERWGGTVEWQAIVPAGVLDPAARALYSQQIIRVQQPNLLARSWDIFATFDVVGVVPGVTILDTFGLEIVAGAGQSSGIGIMILATALARQVDGQFLSSGTGSARPRGAVQAVYALPATAIAIRGYLLGAAGLAQPDTALSISLTVAIAPRALY